MLGSEIQHTQENDRADLAAASRGLPFDTLLSESGRRDRIGGHNRSGSGGESG